MSLLTWLIGCRHPGTTWPQGKQNNAHITCLDCGAEFSYDWQEMKREQFNANTNAPRKRRENGTRVSDDPIQGPL